MLSKTSKWRLGFISSVCLRRVYMVYQYNAGRHCHSLSKGLPGVHGELVTFSKKCFEDISPFCEATDTPVLDFWWHLPWVSKPGLIPSLACFVTMEFSESPLVWHTCWSLGSQCNLFQSETCKTLANVRFVWCSCRMLLDWFEYVILFYCTTA